MAITAHAFPQLTQQLASKNLNITSGSTDTFKVALGNTTGPVTLATTGVQACVTFANWTAIVPEISGTGYTAGGLAFSPAATTTGNVLTFTTATSLAWSNSTITANQAMFYDVTANVCLAFWDFGGAVSSSSGSFTLTVNAAGIFTVTVS